MWSVCVGLCATIYVCVLLCFYTYDNQMASQRQRAHEIPFKVKMFFPHSPYQTCK